MHPQAAAPADAEAAPEEAEPELSLVFPMTIPVYPCVDLPGSDRMPYDGERCDANTIADRVICVQEEQQKVQIEELIAEKADLETRWKRALADSENTRQMAKREIATSKKFAVQVTNNLCSIDCENYPPCLR